MTKESKELAKYRLERAFQTLDEAKLLFDSGYTNTYVNRLYYACFYAVSALLISEEKSTSKHGQLRAMLHKDYIKTGLLSKESGRYFDLLFQSRQTGDYVDNATFNPEEVKDWLKNTKRFIEEIQKFLSANFEV
ncbi:MAG: HEPN domain-containing protein [Planctomycetes bacterium]|nr:HEPN domain-containing protein [Planctomycetota bacterium]MBU1518405.1 HEPN domain-containing protein [Planctomycetota bacterium]MBU2458618.1 HEPN domain-containing protein [Planctomycetota bacterium]MBU2596513.1 HEPN domain-containing protein [Planctomycetota bacterium]